MSTSLSSRYKCLHIGFLGTQSPISTFITVILNPNWFGCWSANHAGTPRSTVPEISNANSRSTSPILEASILQPLIQGVASPNHIGSFVMLQFSQPHPFLVPQQEKWCLLWETTSYSYNLHKSHDRLESTVKHPQKLRLWRKFMPAYLFCFPLGLQISRSNIVKSWTPRSKIDGTMNPLINHDIHCQDL